MKYKGIPSLFNVPHLALESSPGAKPLQPFSSTGRASRRLREASSLEDLESKLVDTPLPGSKILGLTRELLWNARRRVGGLVVLAEKSELKARLEALLTKTETLHFALIEHESALQTFVGQAVDYSATIYNEIRLNDDTRQLFESEVYDRLVTVWIRHAHDSRDVRHRETRKILRGPPEDEATLFRILEALAAIVGEAETLSKELSLLISAGSLTLPDVGLHSEPKVALLAWGAWLLAAISRNREQGYAVDHLEGLMVSRILKLANVDEAHPLYRQHLRSTEGLLAVAGTWGACGFPTVQIGHKHAASLMATHVPRESCPDVHVPWPSFVVQIPDGMVSVRGLPVRLISLIDTKSSPTSLAIPDRYLFTVFTYDQKHAGQTSMACNDLGALGDVLSEDVPAPWGVETDEQSRRTLTLLGRLMLGVVLELDAREHQEEIQRGPPVRKKAKPGRPKVEAPEAPQPASPWMFELRRDIQVDCRTWVSEYVEKGSRSQGVRRLVRGHARRQVWGKGRALRKWIWVEPYWSGGEHLPIAVRAHVLPEPKE